MEEDIAPSGGRRKRKTLSQVPESTDVGPIKRNRRENGSGPDPKRRAGTISRIVLKNFMCHSLLEVDLSKNINIIVGQNGSGKSAILTAIIVGLGGKASLTNRGTSIKGFVKAGRASGSVEIEIYNEGPMAYRPNIYGDRITISRSFNASGSSTYRVKSASGEVISMKLAEVQKVTVGLNIQVDNPVCILNQDTARNFLSSSNPKHKFLLFMKATRLDTLNEAYKQMRANKMEGSRAHTEKRADFETLRGELLVLKQKIDEHNSIHSIQGQLKLLQVELLWTKVRDAEGDKAKVAEVVDELDQRMRRLQEKMANREDKLAKADEVLGGLKQQMAQLEDTLKVQRRPQNDLRSTIDELKVKFAKSKQQKQLLSNTVESRTRDVESLQREIDGISVKMSKVEQEKMQRLRALQAMMDKIKNMEDHLQTATNDLFHVKGDVAQKEETLQNCRSELMQIDHRIDKANQNITHLKNDFGNSLLLYGREMPQILALIDQNKNKFGHAPRGPLGRYVKVRDKKWTLPCEAYIGARTLQSFAVDSQRDCELLKRIFDQVYGAENRKRNPTIITSKFFFKQHDVRPHLVRAPHGCVSLYGTLEIDDPIAANCLIDQLEIESVLLAPDDQSAMALCSEARNVPKNCKRVLTAKGDEYFPDPNYKTYGCALKAAAYLQVDTKDRITQLQQDLTELTHAKNECQRRYDSLNQELAIQRKNRTELEEKVRKLNATKVQIRRQIADLHDTAEPEVANADFLEAEMREIRAVILAKTAELETVDEKINEIRTKIGESEEKLRQFQSSNSSLEERKEALLARVNEEKVARDKLTSGESFEQRHVREIESKLDTAQQNLRAKGTIVDTFTKQALAVGDRNDTNKTVAEIMNEIAQLERSVRRIEHNAEDPKEIAEKYAEIDNKCNVARQMLATLKLDLADLDRAIQQRKRHYKLTEDFFLTFIKVNFKKILEFRQFEGSIEVDMIQQKLDLTVIPQQGSQGLTTTSNLSGGERSFSTVAFLHSLWQCMDFPFYFLDEFDVFMDKQNRSKVFEILIHHAKNHPELQFAFLTPQDISFLKADDVNILRMLNPERMNA